MEVEKHILPNGLTVLLKEDRRLPVACVLTWVKVGYFDEPDSHVGISHYIEHLFFKGTSRRPVGQIAKETKAIGGYLNASTFYDYTYYYTVVPKENVVQALDIQSDSLMNPLFDAGEMEREKEVVIQEYRRKLDNPDALAWEKLVAQSFQTHRMRRWRMGTDVEIRKYTRDQVVDYYHRYYSPKNIIVSVVGDIDLPEVLKAISERYGTMETVPVVVDASPAETPQSEARLSRMLGDISHALVKIGFQAPSVLHEDYFPLHFLSILLGKGRSSRLYRNLKEERDLVTGIGSSLFATEEVGFFTIELETQPEKIAASEEEVWLEIERLHRDPPTEEEMARVRNIVEANFFSDKEDVMGQAYSLAYFESLGDYDKATKFVEKIRSVTVHDVVSAAQRYLSFSKMNILEYVPRDVGEGAAFDLRLESLKKRFASRTEKLGPRVEIESAAASPEVISWSGVTEPVVARMEEIQIPQGPTLLYLPTKALPLASMAVYFPGGRLDETDLNCGITQFLLDNTLKGTESKTADELAFELESLGTFIRAEANADLFGYSCNILSRNLEKGADLLADVILEPRLSEREIEIERSSTLAAIKRLRDDPFRYSVELFYKSLYGLHPYGLPRIGTDESIQQLHRNQLMDWYTQTFSFRKMVVAIVGDVERSRAIDLVSERFSVLKDSPEEPRAQIIPVHPNRGMRECVEERDRKQTSLCVGFSGVTQKDSRYFALEVLRNLLSGMGGRLFMELREKHPLVYTVTAFNIALLRGGAFFTYVASSPEKEAEAKSRLFSELERVRRQIPTREEMEAARAYTRGSQTISLQGNGPLAYTFLHHYMVGRGLSAIEEYDRRIAEVTAEEVRMAAYDILNIDQASFGIVRGRV